MGFRVISWRLRGKLVLTAEVGGGSMGVPYAALTYVCVSSAKFWSGLVGRGTPSDWCKEDRDVFQKFPGIELKGTAGVPGPDPYCRAGVPSPPET